MSCCFSSFIQSSMFSSATWLKIILGVVLICSSFANLQTLSECHLRRLTGQTSSCTSAPVDRCDWPSGRRVRTSGTVLPLCYAETPGSKASTRWSPRPSLVTSCMPCRPVSPWSDTGAQTVSAKPHCFDWQVSRDATAASRLLSQRIESMCLVYFTQVPNRMSHLLHFVSGSTIPA